ncbi:MAG: UDP-N-acetylglucosamine diphosphorylase [Clostridia bacterium]|nr:UDP-N-acetylglucosamine diphosphorylase [Clostridia bacterium]
MKNISPLAVVDSTVSVGCNVTIEPFCVVTGDTALGNNVVIKSFCTIANCTIDDGTVVDSSHLDSAVVGKNCQIGPYARLRKGAVIGDDCRVGNFVEIKNTTLGCGTKASHLSYLGDATLGANCNVGCGVITANYDGASKHHTQIGDNVFLGCNSNIIAPAKLGDNVFVACATTVDGNVPSNALSIGRARQQIKPNYPNKYTQRPTKQ